MRNIDVTICGDLLKSVGAKLLEMERSGELALDEEALLRRFAEANGWAKETIRAGLAQTYPDIRWSEAEFDLKKQRRPEFVDDFWICDAIDGAAQFLQAIPSWCPTLCLIHKGRPIFSMIYHAHQQELFYAIAGEGAYLNGQRINVSGKQAIAAAFIGTTHLVIANMTSHITDSSPGEDVKNVERTCQTMASLIPQVFAVRMLGATSLQLAYVACGRLDGYWEFGDDLYDWLAGALLVQEAGGVVTSGANKELTWGTEGIIAANAPVHQALQACMALDNLS